MKALKMAVASALTVGAVAVSTTTAEAQPIITGGLVNVVVGDVTILEDVRVGVALAVAANLCDISVNVLAEQFKAGDTTCMADPDTVVEITP